MIKMFFLGLFLQVFTCQALAFLPPGNDTVNRWVNLALTVDEETLNSKSQQNFYCGPMDFEDDAPSFRAFGGSFEMAQARAGLLCIRWNCRSIKDKVGRQVEDYKSGQDLEYLENLLAAMGEDKTFEEIMGLISRGTPAESLGEVSCETSQNARILAYDNCFGRPTVCD